MSFFRLKKNKERPDPLKEIKTELFEKELLLMQGEQNKAVEKDKSDYSEVSHRIKKVQPQMILFLKSKLKGTKDKLKIEFLMKAIVNAEIKIITADLEDIVSDINQYKIDEDEEWARENNVYIHINNLKVQAKDKYMPLLQEKKAGLISKYPQYKEHINEKINEITKNF